MDNLHNLPASRRTQRPGGRTLWGGTGNDVLDGGIGKDKLFGQVGDDILMGFTASNDAKQTLTAGETDNDTMYGGIGNDRNNWRLAA